MGEFNGTNVILLLKKGLEDLYPVKIVHYTGDGWFDYNPDDYIEFIIGLSWSTEGIDILFNYCNINDWKQWVKNWRISPSKEEKDALDVIMWLNHKI